MSNRAHTLLRLIAIAAIVAAAAYPRGDRTGAASAPPGQSGAVVAIK